MISRQRRAWTSGSGSHEPSGHTGAVPDTSTRSPTRTARLKPILGSQGEPDETRRRASLSYGAGMKLGSLDVIPVSDGTAKLPPGYFPGSDWEPHKSLLGPDGNMEIALGCFLVRTPGPTVLVDAGIGPVSNPIFQGGELPASLRKAGASPEDIDIVLCTHLHLDHAGWLVQDGKPFFPNATVRFGAADWEQFVTNADPADAIRRGLEILKAAGRISPVESDGEIAPGVSTMHAPGHTHGHSCVVLSSGTKRAFLLGDAVTCPVQLEETEWEAMSDVDSRLAKRTREALWRELDGTGDVAVAAHFPGLQFGRVLSGEGKRYWA